MALTTVNSDGVKNDSIKNIDIKSDAAVEGSKLDNPLQLPDDHKISFGTTGTGDLEIYHSGGNSFIHDGGDGGLYIRGSILGWRDAGNSNASWINTNAGAGVELYYAGNNKFETVTGGVNVTGNLEFAEDTNTALHHPAADTLAMTTAGTERLRINSDGQVLIGNTSPAESTNNGLEVFQTWGGRIGLSRNDTGTAAGNNLGMISFYGNDANGAYQLSALIAASADLDHDTGDKPGRLEFHTTPDGSTTPVERLRIDSSGRVLIGTTTEGRATWGENLTIANSASCGMTIRSGTGSYGSLYFSDAESDAGEYAGLVEYYHSEDKLAFYTGTAQRLVLDNSGKVTINDGDLKIGTAGHGIDFSAQTNEGSTSQDTLLADYEEGTWTPTNSVGLTLTVQNTCYYLKVGKLCTVWFDIKWTGYADSAQCSLIQSLPYVSSDSTDFYCTENIWYSETDSLNRDYNDETTMFYIGTESSSIQAWNTVSNHLQTRAWAVVDSSDGRRVRGTMTYLTKD
jgi:hypothetical protein